jgi:hypothetical protein
MYILIKFHNLFTSSNYEILNFLKSEISEFQKFSLCETSQAWVFCSKWYGVGYADTRCLQYVTNFINMKFRIWKNKLCNQSLWISNPGFPNSHMHDFEPISWLLEKSSVFIYKPGLELCIIKVYCED